MNEKGKTTSNFHSSLKKKMDEFVHTVYKVTRSFPKEEMYCLTSQLRRAALSVILNYIEGYARINNKVNKNFLEISYGSLKESEYLIEFAYAESLLDKKDSDFLLDQADQIGAMLWSTLKKIVQ